MVHFTVACLVAKPFWTGMRLRLTLLWYKRCYFSNVNYSVIILTGYWSLSQYGYLQYLSLQIKGLATKYTTVKWPIVTSEEQIKKAVYISRIQSSDFPIFGVQMLYHLSSGQHLGEIGCKLESHGNGFQHAARISVVEILFGDVK